MVQAILIGANTCNQKSVTVKDSVKEKQVDAISFYTSDRGSTTLLLCLYVCVCVCL